MHNIIRQSVLFTNHATRLARTLLVTTLAILFFSMPKLSQARIEGFKIIKSNGLVKQITLHLTKPNRILILDRFTKLEAFIKDEKEAFSTSPQLDPICQKRSNPKNCEQTCYWASKARPFSRIRLLNSEGKTLWSWQTKVEHDTSTWSKLNPGIDGACLSPDRQYLSTADYLIQDDDLTHQFLGYSITSTINNKSFEFIGKKTNEPFGHKRFTHFISWQTNKPHTIIFEVARPENENQPIIDTGEPHEISR